MSQSEVTGQEMASCWYGAVRQYNYLKEPDVLHANVNAGTYLNYCVLRSSIYFFSTLSGTYKDLIT